MKERPIIMSGDNPKLILEGRKTQTRRIVKPQPQLMRNLTGNGDDDVMWSPRLRNPLFNLLVPDIVDKLCPYGVAGDRLWVKEKFSIGGNGYFYGEHADGSVKIAWTSARFMPRKASRITLEITKVRVERLQDITPADCHDEGILTPPNELEDNDHARQHWAYGQYAELWDSLHGKGAWELNPWVWVLDFKRVQ